MARNKNISAWISCEFPHLSQVAELVLTLPQSNADEERVFSLVSKNKTDFRESIDLNRILSSVITDKMNLDESSHQFKPCKNLLKKANVATWIYNQLHNGKSRKIIIHNKPLHSLPVPQQVYQQIHMLPLRATPRMQLLRRRLVEI